MTRANSLTIACLSLLRMNGAHAWRNNTIGVYNPTTKQFRRNNDRASIGGADILACLNGRFIAVEVKVGRDRLSDNQKRWGAALEQAGGVYIVCKDNTDALIKWLADYKGTHEGICK